ncbi:neoverrucotoxin subunit alpha-like [Oreochromis niloticus]|uniref:neoverrucotoxin subunit alpha-like n=1 Tax=Oreochromis niloticus TaxID=8128 RepID=UPI000905D143|nr:neoverrucotoxin subunit alpha-like [Oreochromis niloticus]
MHPTPMVPPVGGGPPGRWVHVPLVAGLHGLMTGHQTLALRHTPRAWLQGVTLWDDTNLQDMIKESEQPSTDFKVTTSDSTDSKSTLLDVDASLKASVLCGLVEVGGSAKYLNDKKKSHKQSRVTLQYKVTTKFKQLTLTPQRVKNTQQVDGLKHLSTHVVTGILYGANAFFVFDSEKLDGSSIQDIQGTMKAVIEKIPSINVPGNFYIKLSKEEKAVTDKFTCKFYGDFILESNPVTFEDAINTYIQLPKLLGKNKENGVPLKVTLMPLENLHPEATGMMTEISIEHSLRKAQDALKDLQNLDVRCNDLLEDRVVKSFPQIKEKLSRFKKLCEYYTSSLQKTMAEKLPSIRAAEEDQQELVKLFDARDESPFSQQKLTKWIKDEEREVTIISHLVHIMEGKKIISDQSELDREVFNPGAEEVFCFVFTSLKSTDPYLQNMSDFLDKKKLEQSIIPPTQDQWYFSDEVVAKMKEKAEAVKNSIRLFITAISNDKYKGATIYHYRNTVLVTDDFSGPDVTDLENRMDRRDLMSSPGPDMVHPYWLKKLTALHEYLEAQMNQMLVDERPHNGKPKARQS